MKDKKMVYSLVGIALLIVSIVGVTYAFFNYTRTGTANNVRVGRINFVTRQTKTINLTNLFPIDPTDTEAMADPTKVGTFEIEIEGDTDYVDGVEYLVSSTNTHITTSDGKIVPISLSVTPTNLGTENANYFTARENKNITIYKKLVGDTLVGDQMLLVGYIKPNTTRGTAEGIQNGKLTIKAYLDENKILVSDTYDGTESDNMGTPKSLAEGKTVLTTTEWKALSSSGLSFQIKVEANEGIWVNDTLDNIIRTKNLNTTTNQPIMDNVRSEFVSASTGINFGAISSDTNGKGVYMRAGTENDAYPIVYYRGAVEDNNVIFNNKCWKAVRTTDTGGVKLIYNGEPGAVYGEIPLTENQYTIPSGVTNNFTFDSKDNSWNITITDNAAKEISFTVPAGDGYKLVQTGTSGSSTGGTWTFYKDGTNVKSYGNGGGQPMNDTYEFGTLTASNVIKWTYTGSSSIESPITFKLQMVQLPVVLITENGCANTGIDTHISILGLKEFKFNPKYTSPAYVGYMYGDVSAYNSVAAVSGAYYGSGFTYSNGVYTLTNPSTTKDNNHHYTCNQTISDRTCATIRYYYYGNYYVNLTGGDGIEKALEKMQKNINDSVAKTQIDSWYAVNMVDVTSKLEDTIWCNDRSMGNKNNNGWIANGGDLSTYLYYGAYQRSNYASNTSTVKNQPSLACTNKNDAFTVSNGNGNQKLTYPVALLTEDEMVLAGGLAGSTSTFYLNNGNYYWSLSPSNFSIYNAHDFSVNYGNISNTYVNTYYGLRPSISIKPGMPVVKGNGTVADPYIIDETMEIPYVISENTNSSINKMSTFPSDITNNKSNIKEIYFNRMNKREMFSRFDTAVIKANITDDVGMVLTWLEPDAGDNTKYIMYVVSDGDTYLTTGNKLFYEFSNVEKIEFNNVNTDYVTDMYQMFYYCSKLLSIDLHRFNTENVQTVEGMFYGCSGLTSLDLSYLNMKNVYTMKDFLYRCNHLTVVNLNGLGGDKLSNIQNMFGMCDDIIRLNMSGFNFGNISSFSNNNYKNVMFNNVINIQEADFSNIITKNVTNMSNMFNEWTKLQTLNLSGINTSNITNMDQMFMRCNALKTIYVSNSWNVSNVISSIQMFNNCKSLVGGSGTVYDENYIDKTRARIDGGSSNPGYLTLIS